MPTRYCQLPLKTTVMEQFLKKEIKSFLRKERSSQDQELPKWKNSYKLILTTLTAAKLHGICSWVHLYRLKLLLPETPQVTGEEQ